MLHYSIQYSYREDYEYKTTINADTMLKMKGRKIMRKMVIGNPPETTTKICPMLSKMLKDAEEIRKENECKTR